MYPVRFERTSPVPVCTAGPPETLGGLVQMVKYRYSTDTNTGSFNPVSAIQLFKLNILSSTPSFIIVAIRC